MTASHISKLGKVMQLAYRPKDFEGAIRYWVEVMGVGPFFVLENITMDNMKFRGQPTECHFSIALAYWGDMQIELLKCDGGGPSIYNSEYGVFDQLHHVCIIVPDMNEVRRVCAEAGAEVIMEGKAGGSGEAIYVDPGMGPGHLVEFYQYAPGNDQMFAMMQDAAKTWDGTDPVRKLTL